ncbi:MAG: helix-turn-helix domain-containing protein [Anaerolineales bacterium]|nr:helix-turn-helix domain-containing protein [Anaerolineales bacterium]
MTISQSPRPKRKNRRYPENSLPVLSIFEEVDEVNVGANLRAIRNQQGLSLRDLAEMSGLNVNTLSMIENNKTSPSVSTLHRLATALRMPITAFFELGRAQQPVIFQRAGQRRRITFEHGSLENLGGGLSYRGGIPLLVSLDPGSSSGDDTIVHTGFEFVYCLEGCLTYTIGDTRYDLQVGDSLLFEAHLPHRWGNFSSQPSQSLLILCLADERDRLHERHFSLKGIARGSGEHEAEK